MLGFLCIITWYPIGLMGVALHSKVPLNNAQDDMLGFRVACRSILMVSSACSRSRPQRYFGKDLLMNARTAGN